METASFSFVTSNEHIVCGIECEYGDGYAHITKLTLIKNKTSNEHSWNNNEPLKFNIKITLGNGAIGTGSYWWGNVNWSNADQRYLGFDTYLGVLQEVGVDLARVDGYGTISVDVSIELCGDIFDGESSANVADLAVLPSNGHVRIFLNGGWHTAEPWIFLNGGWHKTEPWIFLNGGWHKCN